MAEIKLNPAELRQRRAQAQGLRPVVIIGAAGLTDAVRAEVDTALRAHGLVKVRVLDADRDARAGMSETLAHGLEAAQVQQLGKCFVLWRPLPEPTAAERKRGAGPRTAKVVRYSKRGGQRPSVKRVRVLGNERVTAGGKVKRARKRQTSVKKSRPS